MAADLSGSWALASGVARPRRRRPTPLERPSPPTPARRARRPSRSPLTGSSAGAASSSSSTQGASAGQKPSAGCQAISASAAGKDKDSHDGRSPSPTPSLVRAMDMGDGRERNGSVENLARDRLQPLASPADAAAQRGRPHVAQPVADADVETLQVAMMSADSPLAPIPVQYNSYVFHLIEGVRNQQQKVDEAEARILETGAAHERDLLQFSAMSEEWIERERQYKAEILRLEKLLAMHSEDGMQTVRARPQQHASRPRRHAAVHRQDPPRERRRRRQYVSQVRLCVQPSAEADGTKPPDGSAEEEQQQLLLLDSAAAELSLDGTPQLDGTDTRRTTTMPRMISPPARCFFFSFLPTTEETLADGGRDKTTQVAAGRPSSSTKSTTRHLSDQLRRTGVSREPVSAYPWIRKGDRAPTPNLDILEAQERAQERPQRRAIEREREWNRQEKLRETARARARGRPPPAGDGHVGSLAVGRARRQQ